MHKDCSQKANDIHEKKRLNFTIHYFLQTIFFPYHEKGKL